MKLFMTLFRDEKIRNRLLLTVGLVMLFRALSFVPVPWVNRQVLQQATEAGLMQMVNLFSGGALSNFSLMATGISAYISASIVIQLLTYILRPLHEMQRAPGGERRIRRLTVVIGVIAAFFISMGTTMLYQMQYSFLTNSAWYVIVAIALIHAAGTGTAVWIGETITQKGFGNGVSMLIFVNILSRFPAIVAQIKRDLEAGSLTWYWAAAGVALLIAILGAVVVAETSERRVPVVYAKAAARGNTMFKGQTSFFPMKVNMYGVMPIIFASTLLQVLLMAGGALPDPYKTWVSTWLGSGTVLNAALTSVLIFAFSYFYAALSFNAQEIADQIQSAGGAIPKVKPGGDTAEYLQSVNNHLTTLGACYLAVLSLIPSLVFVWIGFTGIASTSAMIMVGVALEVWQKIKTEAAAVTFRRF